MRHWIAELWISGGLLVNILACGTTLAAEPLVIPASDAQNTASCTVGRQCTFTAPVFACDYESADKIASAEARDRISLGDSLVRAKNCQVISAGGALATAATKSEKVIYIARGEQHLGYMPVGVFVQGDNANRATCDRAGFCAVRAGPPIFVCPKPDDLKLATDDIKSAAKCLRMSDSNVGEVVSLTDTTLTLVNMFGNRPPYEKHYYAERRDFVAISLQPRPTPAARGWCAPDAWCVTKAGAFFCTERAAFMRLQEMPPGEPLRIAMLKEPGCRVVISGNVLKPKEQSSTDGKNPIAVEHPKLGAGWIKAEALPPVAASPPLRGTARLSDLVIQYGKEPALTAVSLAGQGTQSASALFRSGPAEVREFCNNWYPDQNAPQWKSCLLQSQDKLVVQANCSEKRFRIRDRQLGLFERPRDANPDIHTDASRQWLFRDLRSGEWLDGSGASGESGVAGAFDALCPAVNPEASFGLVYRERDAAFPKELQGRWFSSARACVDLNHNKRGYEKHSVIEIAERSSSGNDEEGFVERVNVVRRIGAQAWQIDTSHTVDGQDGEIFSTATYTLTRNGLKIGLGKSQNWVSCR